MRRNGPKAILPDVRRFERPPHVSLSCVRRRPAQRTNPTGPTSMSAQSLPAAANAGETYDATAKRNFRDDQEQSGGFCCACHQPGYRTNNATQSASVPSARIRAMASPADQVHGTRRSHVLSFLPR
jgi:hypothetical protein